MRNAITILVLALSLTSATAAQAPVFDIIAVSWTGAASGIDSATGTGVGLGASGFAQLNNMARDPLTGTIYVLSNTASAQVLTINPVTGAATATGVTIPVGSIRGLAFDAIGTAWAIVDGTPDQLYTVDLLAGTATLVGPTGFGSLQALAADPNTGGLWAWDVNSGTNPGSIVNLNPATGAGSGAPVTGVGAGDIQALTFSPSGVLYGCRNALFTINTSTGVATGVGSGGYSDVRGFDFIAGGPPQPPTYPGNGSDVATNIRVNGAPQPGGPGVHTVNGGDVISMAFVSPGGTLSFFPFLAFYQLFPTGAPPFPDPILGLRVDPLLAGGVIANGLNDFGALFNPVLDAWQAVGGVPFFLGGTGTSILINCVAFDPSVPPFNVGIADAHELVIN